MTALALRGSDVPGQLTDQLRLAETLVESGLLPNHLRDKTSNVLAVRFAARSVQAGKLRRRQLSEGSVPW